MKQIIVTGAASGIGYAAVRRLCDAGYFVAAVDLQTEGLQELTRRYPDRCAPYKVDVSDPAAVARCVAAAAADKGGTLYGLVNNAGIYLAKNLLDYSREEMDRVLAVNIGGALHFTRCFVNAVREQALPGRVVNVTSVAGQEGSSDAVYALTKAALIGLTKSCAQNFAPDILVNAVAPTVVDTPMMDKIPDWRMAEYERMNLIKEPVSAADVAATIQFLLSEDAAHYTGATFDLNNGGYLR